MFTENIFFQNIYGKDKYEILETIGKELKAKEFAIKAHKGQVRKSDKE